MEVVRHPGATAIAAVDGLGGGDPPSVFLIRQYRYATERVVWEVPAGTLDPDESPVVCAARELAEETGYRANRLHHLASVWTTPGFTDELIHLFVAWDCEPGETQLERGEFIEVHKVPLDRALHMVESGEIMDAKSICALMLVDRWMRKGGPAQEA